MKKNLNCLSFLQNVIARGLSPKQSHSRTGLPRFALYHTVWDFARNDMFKKPVLALIGLIIILVLGPTVYFGLIKPNKTSAGWFNDSWLYRKAITFNNSGSAVSNQKTKLI